MAKRDKNSITLGSGKIYLTPYTDSVPTVDTICTADNLLGYIRAKHRP